MGFSESKRKFLFLLLASDLWTVCDSFMVGRVNQKIYGPCSKTHMSQSEDGEVPDLFEYFDPLLSPHAYPNGISQDHKPVELKKDKTFTRNEQPSLAKDLSYQSPVEKERSEDVGVAGNDMDLFEYFDPLLSPHAYPNGISQENKPVELQGVKAEAPRDIAAAGPTGGESEKKVGVLLMDHGSRNPASNERLKHLAHLYQLTMDGENIVVEHSHMEIASPSIPEGLQKLVNSGVDEIICHPYFLSPGRHVREDIPQIVGDAITLLKIKIPVVTTDPVGSNTQLMIGAIHSLVRENSGVLKQQKIGD